MKRVFVCCSDPFPFGTANSNYIRNFAKCLNKAGFSVIVIGIGNNREIDRHGNHYSYCGIKYHNVSISLKGPANFMKAELFAGREMKKILNQYGIKNSDYICLYSSLFSVIHTVLKTVSKQNIISIEVEWLQPFQYQKGKMDPMYIIWNTAFKYKLSHLKNFIPISSTLQKMMEGKGKKTLLLPAMTDSKEIAFNSSSSVRNSGVLNLIYSGAATNKDSFPCMLGGLAKLSDEELKKIRLHLTSLTEEKLRETMSKHLDLLDRVSPYIIYHGWLEYQELLELYSKMDFTLLAREENLATLSNFPSKIPELMAFGVIPLCSSVGDYTHLYLTNGVDSIQFCKDSAEDCNRALKQALSLSDQEIVQMKNSARLCVENRFDYENWTEKVRKFILEG